MEGQAIEGDDGTQKQKTIISYRRGDHNNKMERESLMEELPRPHASSIIEW